jgi:hypothetical protein
MLYSTYLISISTYSRLFVFALLLSITCFCRKGRVRLFEATDSVKKAKEAAVKKQCHRCQQERSSGAGTVSGDGASTISSAVATSPANWANCLTCRKSCCHTCLCQMSTVLQSTNEIDIPQYWEWQCTTCREMDAVRFDSRPPDGFLEATASSKKSSTAIAVGASLKAPAYASSSTTVVANKKKTTSVKAKATPIAVGTSLTAGNSSSINNNNSQPKKKRKQIPGTPKSPPPSAIKGPASASTSTTLSANGKHHARELECIPAPEFPAGWTRKTFERVGGITKGTTDKYWYSPLEKVKLRSMTEVKKFMELCLAHGGDEQKARQDLFQKKKKQLVL